MPKEIKNKSLLFNQDTALIEAYNAVAKLNFNSLITLQYQLSEHIQFCWSRHMAQVKPPDDPENKH